MRSTRGTRSTRFMSRPPRVALGAVLGCALALGLASAAAHAATHNVQATAQLTFVPRDLTINVGDSVTWTNTSTMTHNVYALDGSFRCANGCDGDGHGGDGTPAPTWTFTRVFNQAGTIDYECQIHGPYYGMMGSIVVQSAAAPGTIGFTSATYSQAETGGQAAITVQRSAGSSGMITVNYATSDGSAVAGTNYTSASGTLSWAAGDTSQKSFNVPVIDDGIHDGTHTVNLTLSGPTGGAALGQSTAVLSITDNDQSAPCTAGANALCLGGRFKATVSWATGTMNGTGTGVPLPSNPDSGLFYFFAPSNIEMLIKVLNACPLNNTYWVFLAATTNVQFTVTVVDTMSNKTRVYSNPLNQAAVPVQDTSAFATCP